MTVAFRTRVLPQVLPIDGREVGFQNNGTYIQWRYEATATQAASDWTNLVALADIQGDPGDEVELRNNGTIIQWKLESDVAWTNLVTLADLTGATGAAGADAGFAYRYDDTTADADPGQGYVRLDDTDFTAATEMYISELTRSTSDIEDVLTGLSDAYNVIVTDEISKQQATFAITSVTDATDYVKIGLSGHAGLASLTDDNNISVQFYLARNPAFIDETAFVDEISDITTETVPASANYLVVLNGYLAYKKSVSDPGHAWSEQSADGAYWEAVGYSVTPEAGGFTDLHAAVAAAAAAGYTEIHLDARARTTTSLAYDQDVEITGPGWNLVTYKGTEREVGAPRNDKMWKTPSRVAHLGRRAIDISNPAALSTTFLRTSNQTITTATQTSLIPSDYRDRSGGYQSGAIAAFWVNAGWKRVGIMGQVHFAANSTGARIVTLYKSGSPVEARNGEPVTTGGETVLPFYFEVDTADGDYLQIFVYQASGGDLNVTGYTARFDVLEQNIKCPNGEAGLIFQGSWTAQETAKGSFEALCTAVAAYDVLILSGIETYNDDAGTYYQTPSKMWYNTKAAWANSVVINDSDADWSTSLSVSAGQNIRDTTDNTVWTVQLAHTGTTPGSGTFADERAANLTFYVQLVERWHDDTDDTIWLSDGIQRTTTGSGTFADERSANPTFWTAQGIGDFPQVQSLGYPKLRRLIKRVRELNPDIEIYGYVTAAADAPYWDSGGNPQTQLTSAVAGAMPNASFMIAQWLLDGLEIDGIFADHFNPTFIDATVRNNFVSLINAYGVRLAPNITAASAANLLFTTESQYLQPGSMLVLEGFYRDNGTDSSTGTTALVAELAKHRGRDIRLFAANEEASTTTVTPGSANDLAGKAVFDAMKRPGDAYQYSRTSYDII